MGGEGRSKSSRVRIIIDLKKKKKHSEVFVSDGEKGPVHKTLVRKGAIFFFPCKCCVEFHMQRKRFCYIANFNVFNECSI